MKKLFILSVILFSVNCAFAAPNFNLQQNTEPQSYQLPTTLKGRVVTVPAGETFKAVVTSPVSSENAVTGQSVTLALSSDLYYKRQQNCTCRKFNIRNSNRNIKS